MESGPVIEMISAWLYVFPQNGEDGLPGTEVHCTYWANSVWGYGVSYGAKKQHEGFLHEIAVLGSWNPTQWLTLNAGPSFVFPTDQRSGHIVSYVETELNYRPNHWFHLGPVVGFTQGKHTEVFSGIHFGFEF
ncbi:MAG: hypothetical protein JJ975_08180 [Bacteroidia bacterium]|nr:hypothetical protein [Bacteroidia bacterium]